MKQQCLRSFEVAADLSFNNAANATESKILFDEYQKNAEVIFIDDNQFYHEVMTINSDQTQWEGRSCILTLSDGFYSLSLKNGKVVKSGMRLGLKESSVKPPILKSPLLFKSMTEVQNVPTQIVAFFKTQLLCSSASISKEKRIK